MHTFTVKTCLFHYLIHGKEEHLFERNKLEFQYLGTRTPTIAHKYYIWRYRENAYLVEAPIGNKVCEYNLWAEYCYLPMVKSNRLGPGSLFANILIIICWVCAYFTVGIMLYVDSIISTNISIIYQIELLNILLFIVNIRWTFISSSIHSC